MNLKDDPRAYAIMGCAMRVHRTLGFGFLESAYGDALEIEFRRAGIPFVREDAVKILYEGKPLKTTYRADFTCHDRGYLVELKAIKSITKVEWAQVIHYLRATRIPHALLLNFGRPQLQYDTFDLDSLPQASVIATAADTPAKPVGGESETRSAGHSAERECAEAERRAGAEGTAKPPARARAGAQRIGVEPGERNADRKSVPAAGSFVVPPSPFHACAKPQFHAVHPRPPMDGWDRTDTSAAI